MNKEILKRPIVGNMKLGLGGETYEVLCCPTCKEPTYGLSKCAFCGQVFLEERKDEESMQS